MEASLQGVETLAGPWGRAVNVDVRSDGEVFVLSPDAVYRLDPAGLEHEQVFSLPSGQEWSVISAFPNGSFLISADDDAFLWRDVEGASCSLVVQPRQGFYPFAGSAYSLPQGGGPSTLKLRFDEGVVQLDADRLLCAGSGAAGLIVTEEDGEAGD